MSQFSKETSISKNVIYVSGLPQSVTDQELNAIFGKYGSVISIHYPESSNKHRRSLYIEYQLESEGLLARKNLHGMKIHEQRIFVDYAPSNYHQFVNTNEPKISGNIKDRIIKSDEIKAQYKEEDKKIIEDTVYKLNDSKVVISSNNSIHGRYDQCEQAKNNCLARSSNDKFPKDKIMDSSSIVQSGKSERLLDTVCEKATSLNYNFDPKLAYYDDSQRKNHISIKKVPTSQSENEKKLTEESNLEMKPDGKAIYEQQTKKVENKSNIKDCFKNNPPNPLFSLDPILFMEYQKFIERIILSNSKSKEDSTFIRPKDTNKTTRSKGYSRSQSRSRSHHRYKLKKSHSRSRSRSQQRESLFYDISSRNRRYKHSSRSRSRSRSRRSRSKRSYRSISRSRSKRSRTRSRTRSRSRSRSRNRSHYGRSYYGYKYGKSKSRSSDCYQRNGVKGLNQRNNEKNRSRSKNRSFHKSRTLCNYGYQNKHYQKYHHNSSYGKSSNTNNKQRQGDSYNLHKFNKKYVRPTTCNRFDLSKHGNHKGINDLKHLDSLKYKNKATINHINYQKSPGKDIGVRDILYKTSSIKEVMATIKRELELKKNNFENAKNHFESNSKALHPVHVTTNVNESSVTVSIPNPPFPNTFSQSLLNKEEFCYLVHKESGHNKPDPPHITLSNLINDPYDAILADCGDKLNDVAAKINGNNPVSGFEFQSSSSNGINCDLSHSHQSMAFVSETLPNYDIHINKINSGPCDMPSAHNTLLTHSKDQSMCYELHDLNEPNSCGNNIENLDKAYLSKIFPHNHVVKSISNSNEHYSNEVMSMHSDEIVIEKEKKEESIKIDVINKSDNQKEVEKNDAKTMKNVENNISITADFIKKNNLEVFIKFFLSGGDISGIKQKVFDLKN